MSDPRPDRALELLVELHDGLPRAGPGDAKSTRRALRLAGKLRKGARIVDLGCGPGAQTLELARATDATILAIDVHEAFVRQCREAVVAAGLRERVDVMVGDMATATVPDGSLDLLWAEGALYLMGVEAALTRWAPKLRPGGHAAFTEMSWRTDDPPADVREYWQREYPGMTGPDGVRAAIRAAGLEPVSDFPLPESAWWATYYDPLAARLAEWRRTRADDRDAMAIVEVTEAEMEFFRRHSAHFGYDFHVARRPA